MSGAELESTRSPLGAVFSKLHPVVRMLDSSIIYVATQSLLGIASSRVMVIQMRSNVVSISKFNASHVNTKINPVLTCRKPTTSSRRYTLPFGYILAMYTVLVGYTIVYDIHCHSSIF